MKYVVIIVPVIAAIVAGVLYFGAGNTRAAGLTLGAGLVVTLGIGLARVASKVEPKEGGDDG